ncbi:MAG: hypothetical protein ACTHKL_29305, partial [Streptosporangiaceae bacterium]
RNVPPELRARLGPELATTSLAHRDGDGGARALARRRAAVVRIEGDQRVGRAVASILSAAGIGRVEFVRPQPEPQPASPSSQPEQPGPEFSNPSRPPGQAQPGPARSSHGPLPRQRRAARSEDDSFIQADLVIFAGRQSLRRLAKLTRDRVPHLAVVAGEAIGVVGPLVVPRRTACLLCLDYVRAGNDPAWPLILAQLGRRRPDPPACDAVLAAAVAAQAAGQALIAIEKGPLASAAVNGTLELVLPDWKWRRRTWPPHPACPCSVTLSGNRQ